MTIDVVDCVFLFRVGPFDVGDAPTRPPLGHDVVDVVDVGLRVAAALAAADVDDGVDDVERRRRRLLRLGRRPRLL